LSLFLILGCEGGNNNVSEPPENTPEYISDNWYLKDRISEKELNAQKSDELQTTRDFVNYIQKNGTEEEQEVLLTHEAEFTQKVLDLVQAIRKRKG
jgi:acyl-homoserine lactone acylase PvdQ